MAVAVVSGPTEEEVHLGPHLHLHLGGVDDVVDDVEAPCEEVADPACDQDGHCGAPAEVLCRGIFQSLPSFQIWHIYEGLSHLRQSFSYNLYSDDLQKVHPYF